MLLEVVFTFIQFTSAVLLCRYYLLTLANLSFQKKYDYYIMGNALNNYSKLSHRAILAKIITCQTYRKVSYLYDICLISFVNIFINLFYELEPCFNIVCMTVRDFKLFVYILNDGLFLTVRQFKYVRKLTKYGCSNSRLL